MPVERSKSELDKPPRYTGGAGGGSISKLNAAASGKKRKKKKKEKDNETASAGGAKISRGGEAAEHAMKRKDSSK